MRQVITIVDRTDDEQNDFLVANGIKIADYMKYKADEKG